LLLLEGEGRHRLDDEASAYARNQRFVGVFGAGIPKSPSIVVCLPTEAPARDESAATLAWEEIWIRTATAEAFVRPIHGERARAARRTRRRRRRADRVVQLRRAPALTGDLRRPELHSRPYDLGLAYGQSKTANVLFAVEATRRWGSDGITANAVHPGTIVTSNLLRDLDP
jgi:hypothetical protein